MTNVNFAALVAKAHAAGDAAATAAVPTPMIVGPGDILVNGAPVLSRSYYVSEGACGFAWINIRPGNSPFANYAKKTLRAHKAYEGGVNIWVSAYGQSMERKEAYAYAYARVLQDAGIKAYAGSRMD